MIRVKCPLCGRKWGIDDHWAGKAWACPGCRREFGIPGVATAGPAPDAGRRRPRQPPPATAVHRPAAPAPPEDEWLWVILDPELEPADKIQQLEEVMELDEVVELEAVDDEPPPPPRKKSRPDGARGRGPPAR
jgi:hypothetical protein